MIVADKAVESHAIGGGDLLGGHDENGNSSGFLILAERLDDVEAAHLRHHEIEDDQIGSLSPRELDRLASAERAQNGARQTKQADGDELHGPGVVIDHEHAKRLAVREWKQSKLARARRAALGAISVFA